MEEQDVRKRKLTRTRTKTQEQEWIRPMMEDQDDVGLQKEHEEK